MHKFALILFLLQIVCFAESLKYWKDLTLNEQKCFSTHVPQAVADNEVLGIAGGVKSRPGEFRHMAALGWKKQGGGYEYHCGGTLISPNFILTAAHCRNFKGRAPDVARLGGANLRDGKREHQPIRITTVYVHPKYRKRRVYNDIALMKLASNSEFGSDVACLYPNEVFLYDTGTIVGYGNTGYEAPGSEDLLKADLQIIMDNDNCKKFYPKGYRFESGLVDTQFCAGDRNKVRDTCPGDSGGPILVYLKISNKTIPFVMGVTSFGRICASGPPGVYTKVSSYLDWIESIVWPSG